MKYARDIEGRSYDKLRNAFLYRKKLVKNCSCRAKPWSVAERIRHRSYAEVKTETKLASAEINPDAEPNPAETSGLPDGPGETIAAAQPVTASQPEPIARLQPARQYRSPMTEPPRRVIRRRAVQRRRVVNYRSQRPRRARPIQQNSWGLGGAGLPQNPRRQRWPGDP